MSKSMTTRRLGRGNAGIEVPIVGQGTWAMERDGKAAVAALRAGLDLGMTHIDMAEMYGSGAVERLVGEAIRDRRDEVYLVSKVMPQNASRKGTIAACEASLARLGTDRLDLYLLHWPGERPLAETLEAFAELERAGKIRAWGLSNFDVDALEAAEALAPGKMACNQVLYHLAQRHVEAEVLPWCQKKGVALVAYSPLAQGAFPRGGKTAALLAEIAKKHDGTSEQVAMAFLLREAGTFVIPKASRLEHVRTNAGTPRLRLDADDLAAIDRAFPMRHRGALPTL